MGSGVFPYLASSPDGIKIQHLALIIFELFTGLVLSCTRSHGNWKTLRPLISLFKFYVLKIKPCFDYFSIIHWSRLALHEELSNTTGHIFFLALYFHLSTLCTQSNLSVSAHSFGKMSPFKSCSIALLQDFLLSFQSTA